MTRAFAVIAVVAFVGVLSSSGCHEEPTIVIKFEPNDLSGVKTSADLSTLPTTRPADMTIAAATTTTAKTAAKPKAALECKAPTDCVVVPVDCCDCANGGKQRAISKKNVAAVQAERKARCAQTMCTMMMSTDPSCGQRADCVAGACALVKKK
jgi:hypothetical protein